MGETNNNLQNAASILGPAASLVGAGINAISQGAQNRKQRKWNEHMLVTQRKWAAEDWDKQNKYNSPAQQMQRLREAGLNPHLIYGGNSAVQAAQSINQPSPQSWNPQTPNMGAMLTDPVNAYMETRSFNANQRLLDAQTLKVLSEIDLNKQKFGFQNEIQDWQASIVRENLTGKMIGNQFQSDENARREALTSSSLSEAITRMAKTRSDIDYQDVMKQKGKSEILSLEQARKKVDSEIENLNLDARLKRFEAKLNDAGFTKSDPVYFRLAKTAADIIGLDVKTAKEKVDQFIKQVEKAPKVTGTAISVFRDLLFSIMGFNNNQ